MTNAALATGAIVPALAPAGENARAYATPSAQCARMRRRPYPFQVALTELGFAIIAFGCGLYDGPIWLAGLASFGMLAYWSWTRRVVLNRLRGLTWARAAIAACVVLICIQAGAYWLGLGIGESLS